VQAQAADPDSDLMLFRALIRLHKLVPALRVGAYRALGDDEHVLAYVREHDGERVLVALGLSAGGGAVDLSSVAPGGRVLVATHPDRDGQVTLDALVLRPGEGLVVALP
jgi:alpha-glucosidase